MQATVATKRLPFGDRLHVPPLIISGDTCHLAGSMQHQACFASQRNNDLLLLRGRHMPGAHEQHNEHNELHAL